MRYTALLVVGSLSAALCTLPTYAQGTKRKASDSDTKKYVPTYRSTALATIGTEKITLGEVEDVFLKNTGKRYKTLLDVSRDSVVDFVNLYANYKLKVKDAESKGVHKKPEVEAEIASNRDMLAGPFFLERRLTAPWVDKAVSRRQKEVLAGVIQVGQNPNSPDTAQAFQKAQTILARAIKGEDFGLLATEFSDDDVTKKNKGVLPQYITGAQVLRELEDAVFDLKNGQVYPQVVRTRLGWFVVKKIDERPRTSVKARHILVAYGSSEDSLRALSKADSLQRLLNSGADFATLASQNSDDPGSKSKGGDLGGWYSRSLGFEGKNGPRLLPEFEQQMFQLKPGETSKPFPTSYGFHIIKVDSLRYADPENVEEREEMKKFYKTRTTYFEDDRRKLIDSLKKAWKWKYDAAVERDFLSSIDTSKATLDNEWDKNVPSGLRAQAVLSWPEGRLTVGAIIDSVKNRADLRGYVITQSKFQDFVHKITDPAVLKKATAQLEKEYPDFGSLMKEFRDGILIYRVENEEVWSKMAFDSSKAFEFWQTVRAEYKTPKRYDVTEIFVLSDSVAKDVHKQALAGANFGELAGQYTQRDRFREKKGAWGFVAFDSPMGKIAEENGMKPGDISKPFKTQNGWSIVRVNGMEMPREKTFEEAIPDLAARYQDHVQQQLSAQWIQRLRSSYPVKLNMAEINSLWK